MTEAASRILLNARARVAVRDLMSGTTLREIDQLWQDEGFAPVVEDPGPVGGQRVTHFQGYLNTVDWTDPRDVNRALRVFEVALRWLFNPPPDFERQAEENLDRLRRLFGRDGYRITPEGRILGGVVAVGIDDRALSAIEDPHVLREHLVRIEQAVGNDDPALVIGSAKELIESTAKIALRSLEEPVVPNRADITDLVRLVQMRLRIHPQSVNDDGPDGSVAIKRALGATTTISAGIAELRNAGYGTGHGHDRPRSGLGTRHARLAINAARTWCEFILDTLSDERAPWRRDE